MENIDVSGLKRRPDVIKSYFNVKGNITTVNEDVIVVFPERYINRKLVIMGTNVSVVSCYAIIDNNNNYAVCSAPIFQTLSPTNMSDSVMNGVKFKVLYFDKGSVFIPNNKLIVRDSFIYELFDEFFVQGKIPWYINYTDISNLFLEADKYAGSRVGDDPLIYEILTSIISRSKDDKKEYFKNNITEDLQPAYVGLNNPYYSFNNTGARIIGSRFGTGLNVALVEPEKKTSETTDILRS